jgi:hypothetical protein
MLQHICYTCDKTQDARISPRGVVLADNKLIKDESDTCRECDDIGEAAKQQALEKRKKKA